MLLCRFVYGVFGIVIGEWPQGRISGRRRQHHNQQFVSNTERKFNSDIRG